MILNLLKEIHQLKSKSNYFTIEELTKSETAKRLNINNQPSKEIIDNLNKLIDYLNPIREEWNQPIYVTSGYRSQELNSVVKGSKTSSHLLGLAVDLWVPNLDQFWDFLVNYLKDKSFDQLILEPTWIHLGIGPKERRSILCNKI